MTASFRECHQCESADVETTRRSKQTRQVTIRSVHVDLPPDLSVVINHIADKAGLSAEALIIDVLRDVFPPFLDSRADLAALAGFRGPAAPTQYTDTERPASLRRGAKVGEVAA